MVSKILRTFLVIGICIFVYACHDNNVGSQVQVQNPPQQIQNPTQTDKTPLAKCLDGQELKADGTCGPVVTPPPTSCPTGQTPNADGTCVSTVTQPATAEAGTEGGACLPNNTCNTGMKCDLGNQKCVGMKKWVLMEGNIEFPSQPTCSLKVGDTVYVGTYQGMFKQTTSSGEWLRSLAGLHVTALLFQQFVVQNPEPHTVKRIYAATLGQGILASDDDGNAWSPMNNGLADLDVTSLVYFASYLTIYAGTSNSGVFASTDHGERWRETNPSLTDLHITHLFSNAPQIYAETANSVFKISFTSGVWEEMKINLTGPSGYPVQITSFHPTFASDGTLYAGTLKDGVFKYASGRWSILGNGFTNSSGAQPRVMSLLVIGNNIYAGTLHGGIFKLTTDAATPAWSAVNQGLPAYEDGNINITYLFSFDNATIYALTDSVMLFKSSDGGTNWSAVALPELAQNKEIHKLVVSGNDVYATGDNNIGRDEDNYIYKWTESDKKWSTVNNLTLPINSLISDGASLYAGTDSDVFKLTIDNSFDTFLYYGSGLLSGMNALSLRDKEIYAGTDLGVYSYNTVGDNPPWQLVGTGLDFAVGTLLWNNTNIYAGTRYGVYKHAIGGDPGWLKVGAGIDKWAFTLLLNGNDIYAGTDLGVFKFSINGDMNAPWSKVGSGISTSVRDLILKDSDIYARTVDGQIFKFTIGVSNDWVPVGPAGLSVTSIASSGQAIYAGTDYGVWIYVE